MEFCEQTADVIIKTAVTAQRCGGTRN